MEPFALVYDPNRISDQIANLVLIHDQVSNYQEFVSGCNSNTLAVVYNHCSQKTELSDIVSKLTALKRIAIVNHGYQNPMFLDKELLFNSVDFFVDITKNIDNLDFLACNTLQYDEWKSFYNAIKLKNINLKIGASNDLTGNININSGADWIMESTQEDIRSVYFTDEIKNYQGTLVTVTHKEGGINYTLDTATFTAEVGANYSSSTGNITIPAKITYNGQDYTVNSISSYAFNGAKITGITLPQTLTTIKDYAFDTTLITTITIPESVTSISYSAFSNTAITTITIPSAVTVISSCLFMNCSKLTTVTINGQITNIGALAFYMCKSLRTINIPTSVVSIGHGAFYMTNIKSIHIPDGVVVIRPSTFRDCKSLTTVTGLTKVTRIEEKAFMNSGITSITLPKCTLVYRSAFADCKLLTSISFSSGEINSEIYPDAFYNTGVTTVDLPANVTTYSSTSFPVNCIVNSSTPVTLNNDTLIGLTNQQIVSLTTAQVRSFNELQIKSLQQKQFAAFRLHHILALPYISLLTISQIYGFSTDQISVMTKDQLINLQNNINPTLITKIEDTTDITLIDISKLFPFQIPLLTSSQIKQISNLQISLLSFNSATMLTSTEGIGVYVYLNNKIRTFTPDQITAFDPLQIQQMSTNQIKALTDEQFGKFDSAKFNALTPNQIAVLTASQVKQIVDSSLQDSSIQNYQQNLNTSLIVNGLSTTYDSFNEPLSFILYPIEKITTDYISVNINGIFPIQTRNLGTSLLKSLSPNKIGEFTADHVRLLTPMQIRSFPNINQMSDSSFEALTSIQKNTYYANTLKEVGFSISQLKSRFGIDDFVNMFTQEELRYEYTTTEIINAMKIIVGTPVNIKNLGFTAQEMIDAGYSPIEMRSAGWTISDLSQYDMTKLVQAGFTYSELIAAGKTLLEMLLADMKYNMLTAIPQNELIIGLQNYGKQKASTASYDQLIQNGFSDDILTLAGHKKYYIKMYSAVDSTDLYTDCTDQSEVTFPNKLIFFYDEIDRVKIDQKGRLLFGPNYEYYFSLMYSNDVLFTNVSVFNGSDIVKFKFESSTIKLIFTIYLNNSTNHRKNSYTIDIINCSLSGNAEMGLKYIQPPIQLYLDQDVSDGSGITALNMLNSNSPDVNFYMPSTVMLTVKSTDNISGQQLHFTRDPTTETNGTGTTNGNGTTNGSDFIQETVVLSVNPFVAIVTNSTNFKDYTFDNSKMIYTDSQINTIVGSDAYKYYKSLQFVYNTYYNLLDLTILTEAKIKSATDYFDSNVSTIQGYIGVLNLSSNISLRDAGRVIGTLIMDYTATIKTYLLSLKINTSLPTETITSSNIESTVNAVNAYDSNKAVYMNVHNHNLHSSLITVVQNTWDNIKKDTERANLDGSIINYFNTNITGFAENRNKLLACKNFFTWFPTKKRMFEYLIEQYSETNNNTRNVKIIYDEIYMNFTDYDNRYDINEALATIKTTYPYIANYIPDINEIATAYGDNVGADDYTNIQTKYYAFKITARKGFLRDAYDDNKPIPNYYREYAVTDKIGTLNDIISVGYVKDRIINAGYRLTLLYTIKYVGPLYNISFGKDELYNAGYTKNNFTAKELEIVYCSYPRLFKDVLSYTASELKSEGYTATELITYEYNILDLIQAGYTGQQITSVSQFTSITVSQFTSINTPSSQIKTDIINFLKGKPGGYLGTNGYTNDFFSSLGFSSDEISSLNIAAGYPEPSDPDPEPSGPGTGSSGSGTGTSSNPICFNKGTQILSLGKQLQDQYIPIESLRIGDLVKTYKHGYRKITNIYISQMRNTPFLFAKCLYKMPKTDQMTNDLLLTGWHSILVDDLGNHSAENRKHLRFNRKIDDKYLLLCSVSDKFIKITDAEEYTIYNLALESDDDCQFGIYANGILCETTTNANILKRMQQM